MGARAVLDQPSKAAAADLAEKFTIFAAEFLATSILVFLTCMGCNQGMSDEFIPALQRSLTGGMGIMITMHLFMHISGAHCNPMTTVCALIIGKTQISLAPFYFASQMAGAVTGYGLLMLATSSEHFKDKESGGDVVCVTSPSEKITPLQAVLVETCVTLVLVFGNCSSWDPANSHRSDSSPLKFGFLVAAVGMAAGPYTGGSMNPARSFAPAFWNQDWKYHWVYWIAPMTAAVTGSSFYKFVFLRKRNDNKEGVNMVK